MICYKETNFKDTAIGKILKDWDVARLGDVVTCEKGKAPKALLGNPVHNTLPYLTAESLRTGSLTQWGEVTEEVVTAHEDDVLLIWDGFYCGDAFTGYEGILSSTMIKIRTNKNHLNNRFLFYILKTHFKELNTKISGMYLKHVNKHVFESLKIPIPPISEQLAIVGVLSVVDEAIGKTGEVIAKTERLKKGLMQELLTKGIGHKEYKQTPIGKTPREWEVIELEDALDLCQYGLSVPLKDSGKYPIVKMDELVNGYVTCKIAKFVDLDDDTFRAFKLENDDILFNRTNSYELVGRTGIFLHEGNYVFASYLIRLRPKRDVFDPQFLTFYLIFSRDRLRQLATRAVHQANINATNLQKLKVPKPPLEEQRKIASILQTMDRKLELEEQEKTKWVRTKQGLMDLLLTGKIRVKVD